MPAVRGGHAAEAAAPAGDVGSGCSPRLGCYGFMALNMLLGMYFSIAYTVSTTVADAVTLAVILLLLALAGWLAHTGGGGSVVVACACGRLAPDAGDIGVQPAFTYEPGGSGGAVLCAVCLEDVRGGEMVRGLPACGHLFHEGCVDVWLRVRRTCPVCRRVLPPRKAGAGAAAGGRAAAATSSSAAVLPPV